MKKGQYEGIGIVFAILFLTLVIFIAMLLFFANRGKIGEEKLASIKMSESNLLLLNYLRTPLNYNGENILMSDLIVLKDKREIEKQAKSIFGKYCFDKCIWKIVFNYNGDKILIDSGVTSTFKTVSLNEFNLTGFDNNVNIKFETGYNQRVIGIRRV